MNDLGNTVPQPANEKDTIPLDAGPAGSPAPENKPPNGASGISRAPLTLGGAGASAAAPPTPRPAAPRPVAPRPAPAAPARVAAAGNGACRISGCKTFFTKLHPGAIEFLDEQINQWLKDNPSVVIQHTNTTTGEVQAKKTEANILITVWYSGHAAKTTPHIG